MAYVGKCLLFHLKYPAEMEQLYEADHPNFDGLTDSVEMKKKIQSVGDMASQEAAELLESCVQVIEDRFGGIGSIRRYRSNAKLTWEVKFRVATRKSLDRHFWIGVCIEPYRKALIPWVYCRGGRPAREEILRILGRGDRGDKYEGWSNGSIALREIKIPIPNRFDEQVERDALITEVREVFSLWTAQEVESVAALSGRAARS